MNKKFYFKIFLGMLASFIFSWFLTKEIFLFQSPKIQANLKQKLMAQILKIKLPSLENKKGIYVKSEAKLSYVLIKENEVEWKEYEFQVRGQKITIKVPRDEAPPSQEAVNKAF